MFDFESPIQLRKIKIQRKTWSICSKRSPQITIEQQKASNTRVAAVEMSNEFDYDRLKGNEK